MVKRRDQPIEPKSDDFEWLFSRAPFRVPTYQRAYDWDSEEVRDFARDVRALVEARVAGNPTRHFFGALITIFYKSEHVHEVIDGQQRLATQTLCLRELQRRAVALDAEAKSSKKYALATRARVIAQRCGSSLEDANGPKLTLSKRDETFFADLLADSANEPKRNSEQSHRRLWTAQKLLAEELFEPCLPSSLAISARVTRLEALGTALLEDGYLVHLFTDDRTQAYRLFSVLNDRGRPLSDGALLRTETLALLEGRANPQRAAEQDWDAILRTGDTFVDDFLAAYYVSHEGVRAPTGQMFDKFKSRFLVDEVSSAQTATKLRKRISTLREETETYSRIRAGDWPFENAKTKAWDRDRLSRLVVALRHNLAHPLLLAVARETDEATYRKLVLLLEPFVFRYINVVGASAAALAAVYYEHAKKVRKDQKLDLNGLENKLKKMAKDHAPDEVFEPLLRDQLRYARNAQRRRLIKHFFTTLEDYEDWFGAGAAGKRKVNAKATLYDLDQVNIEHIYPQNPKVSDATLDELKHALGNLTALDDADGVVAGNETFAKKKPIYAKSKFAITQPLASFSSWDEAAVAARFEFYAKRAKKVFAVQ